jgi:hypothetical protein
MIEILKSRGRHFDGPVFYFAAIPQRNGSFLISEMLFTT